MQSEGCTVTSSAAGPTSGAPQNTEDEIALRGVSHFYGKNQVLCDVNLSIRRGEFFGLLGPSGSGKSTTLRAIGGFIFPTQGSILIEGEDMGTRPPHRRNTTMVFQHLALFPHMTVFDNLAYGLKLRHIPKNTIREKVAKALDTVHLAGFERRYPKQLSGGQQQRVALARALVLEPGVVLFDEPLGSLDLKLRREMQIEIKGIQQKLGKTFVYVTHDQQEAIAMCDRLAVMNEGRVMQVGSPTEIYERPCTKFVADFIGDSNFLEGTVIALDGEFATLDAMGIALRAANVGGYSVGSAAILCVRPERIRLEDDTSTCATVLQGQIVGIVYTGAQRRCTIQLVNSMLLKTDLDAKTAESLHVGQGIAVGWDTCDAYLVRP